MFSEQIRAGRALLRWEQSRLAEESQVSVETIKRLERMDGPIVGVREHTLHAIEEAFGKAGVRFIDDGRAARSGGPGVRFHEPTPEYELRSRLRNIELNINMIAERIGELEEMGANIQPDEAHRESIASLRQRLPGLLKRRDTVRRVIQDNDTDRIHAFVAELRKTEDMPPGEEADEK